MEKIDSLTVKYHDRKVGTLTLSADRKTCVFEYDILDFVKALSLVIKSKFE